MICNDLHAKCGWTRDWMVGTSSDFLGARLSHLPHRFIGCVYKNETTQQMVIFMSVRTPVLFAKCVMILSRGFHITCKARMWHFMRSTATT